MMRRRILLVLVGLLLLSGIPWLLMGRGTGAEGTQSQAVARSSPAQSSSDIQEQITGGKSLAGTVHATVTGVSTGGDPLDAQLHPGPRLYQLVAEAFLTNHREALPGRSTDSAGRGGEYHGARSTVPPRAVGSAPWELLVAAWVLLGAAWLLGGAGRRPAVRK